MASPYADLPLEEWLKITEQLVAQHPLNLDTIRDVALIAWGVLWQTKIGEGDTIIRLDEIDVPATVVGYFFEKLFARELERQHPAQWRGGGRRKEEKDIVYVPNPTFSIEMKSSGQLGTKIFGNRSYNQQTQESSQVSKIDKSGYHITINFYQQTLNLIRFGWIDLDDWKPQKSATGQAAILAKDVYNHKLVIISGNYRLHASVRMLDGVGKRTLEIFSTEGINTIHDLLQYEGNNSVLKKFRKQASESYETGSSSKSVSSNIHT
jgi:ScaI restriction endonuclease